MHAPGGRVDRGGGTGAQPEREHAAQWLIDAQNALAPKHKAAPAQDESLSSPTFVPLALRAPSVEGDIRIQLQRGGTTVTLVWPAAAARSCDAGSRST